ncbi:MAG TPA: hypothetical protein VE999_16260 [Gemmataceae bacterium]|nr:hypothetical protein [Gemmataceae bacterium]
MAALFDLWEKELRRLSRQIPTHGSDPLRHVETHRFRALTDRRPDRDRLEDCRAGNKAASNYENNALFARVSWWRSNLGYHRDAFAESEMNDVDPYARFTQTLEWIAHGWPLSQIDRPGTATPERPRLHAYT